MAARKVDRKVVAMAAVLVAVALLIVAALASGISDIAGAWAVPPEVSEKQQAAEDEADAAQAAVREKLEQRLSLDDAWDLVEQYGEQKYPEGCSLNDAGTIWETAADENTWDLRATCRVGDTDGVCHVVVKAGSSGEPYVDSFEIEGDAS